MSTTLPHPSATAPHPLSSLYGLYARMACVPLLWGGTFIAGRVIAAHVPPATAAVIRFALAALTLLAVLLVTQGRAGLGPLVRLSPRQWLGTLALGATGMLAYNLCFFAALAVLPAGRTSLIVALNPVVTLLAAAAIFGDRLSPRRWLGATLALVGVWIVVTHGEASQLWQSVGRGELAMFGGVCAWAAYTLIGRSVLQGLSPLLSTFWATVWGTLMLGTLALAEAPRVHAADFTPAVWAGLVYLGVLGTAVGFVWYSEGIARLGSARAVVFNNLVPVAGVLLGWLALGEPLSTSLLTGGALALAGVFLVNRAR